MSHTSVGNAAVPDHLPFTVDHPSFVITHFGVSPGFVAIHIKHPPVVSTVAYKSEVH